MTCRKKKDKKAESNGTRQDWDGEDYFAHHTEIQMEGFRKLKKDQEVSFIPKSGNEGLMAMQIISAG